MNTFTIMGIDPGKNMGVTILTVGVNVYTPPEYYVSAYTKPITELKVLNIVTHIFYLDNYVPDNIPDKQLKRLEVLNGIIAELMCHYQPDVFAVEEAFLNIKYPMAVMQLSQYLAIILNTVTGHNPYIKIFKYPPKRIKSCVGAGGGALKDDMLTTISKIPEYKEYILNNLITEHQVDAMAIAYVALKEITEFPFLLYT